MNPLDLVTFLLKPFSPGTKILSTQWSVSKERTNGNDRASESNPMMRQERIKIAKKNRPSLIDGRFFEFYLRRGFIRYPLPAFLL